MSLFKRLIKNNWCFKNIQLLSEQNCIATAINDSRQEKIILKAMPLCRATPAIYNHLLHHDTNMFPQLYSFYNLGETVLLECEYIEGQDLFTYICNSQTDIPFLDILDKLYNTVHILQQTQFSHLDIKPENIIYNDATQQLTLIDLECMTKHSLYDSIKLSEGVLPGTTCYLSPEVTLGEVHMNTDLWNVGLVGFVMVMKYNPIQSGKTDCLNAQEFCTNELRKAGYPTIFVNLISNLLHPLPHKRFWSI